MTPEEKAVIDAAMDWAATPRYVSDLELFGKHGPLPMLPQDAKLADACIALRIARKHTSETTVHVGPPKVYDYGTNKR